MGIRETLNKNPSLTTGVTAGIILIALIIIVWQGCSGGGTASVSGEAYYTIDDGATYFEDDIAKLYPFDKDGKQAVKAYVYKCGNGKPFVLFVERFTPQAKQRIEEARKKAGSNALGGMAIPDFAGKEVKKPGQKDWAPYGGTKFVEITTPKCPDGSTKDIEPVMPN